MSYKGKFRPSNSSKYKGDPTNIIYRSLWELKFMRYCDTNENILKWASEELWIPYKSPVDNRYHKYFPDFYIKYKNTSGKILESLIEIKPARQVAGPKPQKARTKKYLTEVYEYAKNMAKWEAAKEYCNDRKWEFKILTEHDLGV
jgi:hypothetical protein